MRQIIIVLFLFSICHVHAQPVIDSAWLPKPGDHRYYYKYTGYHPSQFMTNAQDSGANKVWDFNSWTKSSLTASEQFDYPSNLNINCSSSQSNLASGTPSSYSCYIKNATGLFLSEIKITWSDTSQGLTHKIWSKPWLQIKTGVAFRGQFSDTVVSSSTVAGRLTDSLARTKEILYRKYDGYGTLKIAGKTYDTVIRIYQTAVSKDSVYISGGYRYTIGRLRAYQWFVPSLKGRALSISEFIELDSSASGTYTKGGGYRADIAELGSTSGMEPLNPADVSIKAYISGTSIMIKGAGKPEGEYTFELHDAKGRSIRIGQVKVSGTPTVIPIEEASSGIYLLKLWNKKGNHQSFKLIKND